MTKRNPVVRFADSIIKYGLMPALKRGASVKRPLRGHTSHFFFCATHLPDICPAKSKSPESFPSTIVATIGILPLPPSSTIESFPSFHVPFEMFAVPSCEWREPVTLSPSTFIDKVKGNACPCASATASHSPEMSSAAALRKSMLTALPASVKVATNTSPFRLKDMGADDPPFSMSRVSTPLAICPLRILKEPWPVVNVPLYLPESSIRSSVSFCSTPLSSLATPAYFPAHEGCG